MKYIKTRDGIYIQCKLKGYENYYCLPNNTNITKEEDLFILKQADNIKELCDEYVVVSGWSLRHYQFKTLRAAIKHSKLYAFEVMYIYGAIWTDKGLIYVAKMNDKGELELI